MVCFIFFVKMGSFLQRGNIFGLLKTNCNWHILLNADCILQINDVILL